MPHGSYGPGVHRETALVFKCAKIWRLKAQCSDSIPTMSVTVADLQGAECHWIREMQESLEVDPKFPTWRQQFGLFTDDCGIWRCGGRLTKANFPYDTRHPPDCS